VAVDQVYDRDHSGVVDLRDQRWGTGPRAEFAGKTAAEMRALLRALAGEGRTSPVPLSVGPEAGDAGAGRPAARVYVEEPLPGLFRFLALDESAG
jgi:hypothetical protein